MQAAIAASTRASMLRAAKSWQNAGQANRALDQYAHIIERFPDSEEAQQAVALMLTLAQEFEQQGRYQLAMSIHDHLQALTSRGGAYDRRESGGRS